MTLRDIARGLRRAPTVVLLLAVISLAALTVTRVVEGPRTKQILAVQPAMVKPPAIAAPNVSTIDLGRIQSAALFHETRAFYVPPAVPVVQSRPDYRLVGTIAIPRQPIVALLAQAQSGARLKVHEGDDVEGWTVGTVTNRGVTLRLGDQQLEISPLAAGQRLPPPMSPIPVMSPVSPSAQAASGPVAPAVGGGLKVLGSPPGTSQSRSSFGGGGASPGGARLYRPPPG